MSFKHAAEPWFAQDVEEMVLTTLTLGLDPWFMGAAPAELNTYFWPARASGDVTVLSSCSGVPVTQWAYEACLDAFARLARDGNPRRAVRLFCRLRRWVIQGIRDAIKIPAEAKIILTRSPAEAYRLAAFLLWHEASCNPMTAILPYSGVKTDPIPLAVCGCLIDGGPQHGELMLGGLPDAVQIAVRQEDGGLRDDDEILDEFHKEADRVAGKPIVYATLGDGTGAVAPVAVPPKALLVLDASQMRLRPKRVGDHVRHGWPVVISGSGFLGAPGATGALVLPAGRFGDAAIRWAIATGEFDFRDGWDPETGPLPYTGCVLRWVPAVRNLMRMKGLEDKAETRIAQMTFAMTNFLEEYPDFAVLDGRSLTHVSICGRDSGIVAFALRDPVNSRRWLTMEELTTLYHAIAGAGVLLGHPFAAGGRAALRIAISAEDVLRGDIGPSLGRLADAMMGTAAGRRFVRQPGGSGCGGGSGSNSGGARRLRSEEDEPHLYC